MSTLTKITEFLAPIAATSKRTEKEALLATAANTDWFASFVWIMQATYDGRLSYNVTAKLPKQDVWPATEPEYAINDFYVLLHYLSSKSGANAADKKRVADFLASLPLPAATLCTRVINRDLRAGFTDTTYNTVFPEHAVYIHPYMRCSLLNAKTAAKLPYPCYSQLKLDGMYVDIVVNKEKQTVVYYSRVGNPFPSLNTPARDAALVAAVPTSGSIQGEAIVVIDGAELDRQTGNGILNSDAADPETVVIYAWDFVPLADYTRKKCNTPYSTRLSNVHEIQAKVDFLRAVETRIVNNLAEILDHFHSIADKGLEGTIVKTMAATWKHGTSSQQFKVKIRAEADLQLIGWNPGKGKFEGMVGSIVVTSSDGIVVTNISGMTDKTRKFVTENIEQMIASNVIVACKFNSIVSSKSNVGKYSLYLPAIEEFRKDKHTADSYAEIRAILENYEFSIG